MALVLDSYAAFAEYLRASRASWNRLGSTPTAYRRGADIVVLHHVSGELADGRSCACMPTRTRLTCPDGVSPAGGTAEVAA